MADFTAISESLDPEEVHQLMDGCFKILMDEIRRYEGTINQFTGDDLRMDYTAVGDTTSLASRMEANAGPGHTPWYPGIHTPRPGH